ncbi:MAG: DNA (cytosine-5-)-methyltransferase [Planctomycetia bacterium]
MPRTRRSKPKFIDLFCGIGGFHYAFEAAGAECVWACDWDRFAQQTYLDNHGMKPWSDIRRTRFVAPDAAPLLLEPDQIPPHDILCAGFPCQPFSIAGVSKKLSLGRKHGFEDKEQGNLFFRIVEILDHYRPQAFVLENVKNLRSHDKGRTFLVIWNTLRELGYHVQTQVLDAKAYVPQHRERIFIVGFRDPLPFEFPQPPIGHGPRLGSILEPSPDAKYTLTTKLWSYLQDYAKKHQAAGNGFGFGLVGPDDVTRTLSARYYKDGSEILIRQGNGRPRRLTPRECQRLMGYPEGFRHHPSDSRAYKQFGNSVVVPVVEAVAQRVMRTLRTYAVEDGSVTKLGGFSSRKP